MKRRDVIGLRPIARWTATGPGIGWVVEPWAAGWSPIRGTEQLIAALFVDRVAGCVEQPPVCPNQVTGVVAIAWYWIPVKARPARTRARAAAIGGRRGGLVVAREDSRRGRPLIA